MAISKRLRYEILSRDQFACRYCGSRAPDAVLVVDHVTPRALGGTDDPTNLVAACRDCNSGKSSVSPDADTVADVEQEAIDWARRVRQALSDLSAEQLANYQEVAAFGRWWNEYAEPMGIEMAPDWRETVRRFLNEGLELHTLKLHAERSMLQEAHDRARSTP
jgi:HNH endonuclease